MWTLRAPPPDRIGAFLQEQEGAELSDPEAGRTRSLPEVRSVTGRRPSAPFLFRTRPAVGAVLWLAFVAWTRPGPFATGWAHSLLLLGPLVLVPLALEPSWAREGERVGRIGWAVRILQLPAAGLFGVAYLLESGPRAAAFVLPWLLVAGLIALDGALRALGRFRRERFPAIADVCVDAGSVFLAVGAAWAVADRAGVRPLDFSPEIVLLTAVHFHHAGFALPILTGLAARRSGGDAPDPVGRLAAGGVILGVPLVAVGITATQLGGSPAFEAVAALVLAAAGALSAWLHVRLTAEPDVPATARGLWTVAAASLVFGMVLAAFYGVRFYLEVPWLDVPWMRALHGTADAVGFGVAGLAGWAVALTRPRARRRPPGGPP